MNFSRGARDFGRVSHIVNVLFRNGLGYFINEIKLRSHLNIFKKAMHHKFKEPDDTEVRLRKTFEELGGSFIKLGQLMSIRPDIIPESYCKELSKLQDKLPPFPRQDVEEIIKTELKKSYNSIFKSFDFNPISAASIGQVHKAELKNGKKVVIKIRRPKIKQVFESDIDIMHFFAKKIEKNKKYKDLNPRDIIDEFEYYTLNELDLRREARFIEIFRKNFSDSKDIVIPEIYPEFCTEKVIVMEYIKGIKVKDLNASRIKHDKKKIINIGINAMIKQIFDFNVFHADLHPANFLILPKNKIAFLDFGIIGVINEDLKSKAIDMILAIVTKDNYKVAEILLDLGNPVKSIIKEDFRKDVSFIMNEWYGKTLMEEPATNMMKRLFRLCVRYGLRMPRDLVLLGKAAVTLEGTCRLIEPEMDVVKIVTPYLKTIIVKQIIPKNVMPNLIKKGYDLKKGLLNFPRKISGLIDTLQKGRMQVDINAGEITEITTEIKYSVNRLSIGIIIAALIISGTITINSKIPPIVLGYPLISVISYLIALIFGIDFFLNRKK